MWHLFPVLSRVSCNEYKFICNDTIFVIILNKYISRKCHLWQTCSNYMLNISAMQTWNGELKESLIILWYVLMFREWKTWRMLLSWGRGWIWKNKSWNSYFKRKKRPFAAYFCTFETLTKYISIVNCYCYEENQFPHLFPKLRRLRE